MAIVNGYCSLLDIKAALRLTDNVDDTLLEMSVEAASREIDGMCERFFYNVSGTRVFNPQDSFLAQTDDIVSVTTLKTSNDGTTFDTTWTSSDYQLEPLNGSVSGLTSPATRVRAVGQYLWPIWSVTGTYFNKAPIQVVGTFGWPTIPPAIKQATILLAMRQFKRYDSPLGVAGFGDIGVMRVGRVDPDVEALIMPFKKMALA